MALKSNGVTQVPDGLGLPGKVLRVNSSGTAGEWGDAVDGRNSVSDGTKLDSIEAGATADQTKADIEGLGIDVPATNLTGTIPAARLSTATTQAESDDSTKIATTAYVVDKITTLIGGAPSTLNDLNELAAAINDDANYNTTLTTALGTKLPLAGGTITGDVSFGDNNKAIFGAGSDLQIYHDGTHSYIKDAGTGYLKLGLSNAGTAIQNASGTNLLVTDAYAVSLRYNGGQKLNTSAAGITVTGNATFADNGKAIFGAGSDLQIYHDGNNGYIKNDTGKLILDSQTGITIDCNNVTNQTPILISNMGAGGSGIILSRTASGTGHITIGDSMDHSRPMILSGTNKSLGFIVRGALGNAAYAAFDFTVDANASNRHPAVMGVRSANNNSLIFQGEQSDSTVVFSVDYDGNVATSGTVDGVDIAARDAVLTSTTTTANDALPKTGGTITGDVTATTVNATTVDLGDWTITEASGSLLFATQGVTKMKLDSSGNLDVVGNINSSAYIYSAAALIVNGKNPALAFDFVNNYFRNSGNDSTFGNSLTFTRASSATMTSSSGQVVTVANGVNRLGHHIYNSTSSSWVNSGILIESEARTNYVIDSHLQTTNNGMGTFLTTRGVFTQNNAVSPDGTTNAAKLAGDGSNNSHKANIYVQGAGTSPGLTDTVTFSVYLKQGTHRYAQVEVLDNAANTNGGQNRFIINIDLQTGTIVGTLEGGSPTNTNGRIENVGNGWYRASVTLTKKGDNVRTDGGVMFSNAGAASQNPVMISGADDYFYVWGAQLEVGQCVSSLIPTSGGVITRAAEVLRVAAAKLPSVVTTPIEVSGTEILTNPGFDTDTDYYMEAGWGIANGVATKAVGTASGALWQDGTFTVTPGKMYKVEIDLTVTPTGSGTLKAQFWGGGGGDTDPVGSSGTGEGYKSTPNAGIYTWYIIPTINRSRVGLISAGGWDGTINSFSVKEVEPYAISSHMKGTLNYNDFGSSGAATFWLRQQYSTTYMNVKLSTQTGRQGQVSGFWRTGGTLPGSSGPDSSYYPGINVPYNISIRHTAAYTQLAVDGTSMAAGNNTSTNPHVGMPAQSGIDLQIAPVYMGTIDTFTMWGEDIGATGSESITI